MKNTIIYFLCQKSKWNAFHIQRNLPYYLLFHCTQHWHHQADLEFCHFLELCNRKTCLFNFPLLKFDIFQCNICNNNPNKIKIRNRYIHERNEEANVANITKLSASGILSGVMNLGIDVCIIGVTLFWFRRCNDLSINN